jgi:hypothetical protein
VVAAGLVLGWALPVTVGLVLGSGLALDAVGACGVMVTSDTSLTAAVGRLVHEFAALTR